ncbi:hypothetical protein DIS24_g6548 [Lasiodiplodia hormozganensis]|uniref:FAD-binding PCMH-type domain-containing protein n=1 Tax=Lasiodiplodia hormozganensis TaxID=869390 RepID=A0AA39YDT0_9PEZI|nr:hypothetical protein DIS24_g6548 [Lasiodiplodia hormozganensis]
MLFLTSFLALGTVVSAAAVPTESLQSCLLTAVGTNDTLVAFPDDAQYQGNDVHMYNLDVPIIPAAVTYPQSVEMISEIVKCAAKHEHKVQARTGGYSFGNYCLGGSNLTTVVVDTQNLKHFSMDESTWIATVGAGHRLQAVADKMSAAGGRAIAQGVAPYVGIGGHATIGGLGPLSRQLGTAADQVVEVQVVLANGTIARASRTENADLFFALRGAGAGFGVVTEFLFQTSPEPSAEELIDYTFTIRNTSSSTNTTAPSSRELYAETLKTWNTIISDPNLSWNLSSTATMHASGLRIHGRYYGQRADFDALALSTRIPNILTSDVLSGTEADSASGFRILGGDPISFYAKSLAFSEASGSSSGTLMTNDSIDALLDFIDTAEKDTLTWFVIFDLAGGKVNAVPADDAAYSLRDTLYFLQAYVVDKPRVDETTRNFLNGLVDNIEANVPGVRGAYPGFVDPGLGDEEGAEQYWGANLPKLRSIKADVDPADVFSNPQSVRPATEE